MLKLASNERIPMTGPMRMLLEIEDMRNATPATASRGGCLCINEFDIGYLPYLNQWKDTLNKRILSKFDGDLKSSRTPQKSSCCRQSRRLSNFATTLAGSAKPWWTSNSRRSKLRCRSDAWPSARSSSPSSTRSSLTTRSASASSSCALPTKTSARTRSRCCSSRQPRRRSAAS